jgi:hypothetical protein
MRRRRHLLLLLDHSAGMQHFFRTQLPPEVTMTEADAFFPTIGMTLSGKASRERTFAGALGSVTLRVRPEGGHYTFVQAETDQTGESRLDRNVKKYFVRLHRRADPGHRPAAAY